MQIDWLKIQHVRNLSNLRIQPSPQLNLFTGPNASGKTAVLEAIYLMSRARSFRTPRVSEVIQHNKQSMMVTAGVHHSYSGLVNTGIEKGYGKTVIHFNGQNIKRISEQAKNLPLVLVAPDTDSPVSGTPKQRRHWLDWAMFHVEPTYLDDWRSYHKALRQRNNLLKSQRNLSDSMTGWEIVMSDTAEKIHNRRSEFIDRLETFLIDIGEDLCGFKPGIAIDKGWRQEKLLSEQLKSNRERDSQAGYTRHGIHRADVLFKAGDLPLMSVCSRGQAKLFLILLLISQANIMETRTGEKPLYLFDDYTAELDPKARRIIIDLLTKQGAQAFITTADPGLEDQGGNQIKMFHVEHGKLVKVVE